MAVRTLPVRPFRQESGVVARSRAQPGRVAVHGSRRARSRPNARAFAAGRSPTALGTATASTSHAAVQAEPSMRPLVTSLSGQAFGSDIERPTVLRGSALLGPSLLQRLLRWLLRRLLRFLRALHRILPVDGPLRLPRRVRRKSGGQSKRVAPRRRPHQAYAKASIAHIVTASGRPEAALGRPRYHRSPSKERRGWKRWT